MKLSLAEKFLILALKPHSIQYLVSADQRNAGVIGAILQDLKLQRNIAIAANKVSVLTTTTPLSVAHQHALITMSKASREKRASTWFGILTTRNRKYRYQLFADLEAKGLVKLTSKQFLFFKYKVAFLSNEKARQQLVHDLKEIIAGKAPEDSETLHLLMIIKVCKLYKLLANDKAQAKQIKQTLEKRFTNDSLHHELGKGIEEMYVASVAAVAS